MFFRPRNSNSFTDGMSITSGEVSDLWVRLSETVSKLMEQREPCHKCTLTLSLSQWEMVGVRVRKSLPTLIVPRFGSPSDF